MSITNHTIRKLKQGETVVGSWLLSGSERVAEVLSQTAIDWIGIDTEHAPHSPERVESLIRAVTPDATPLVRLPSVEAAISGSAKHALDAGAQGIIVPNVETPTDAASIVQVSSFPPTGKRGVAGTVRANAYGERFDDYVTTANEETLITIQLETPSAINRADEILAVDGIDVAFIGENDLSAALGHPGEKDHPEVTAAVQRAFDAAQNNDVYPGIAGRTPAVQTERVDFGFRFFLLGADLTFMRTGLAPFLTE
ncbi:HpcH/HpaI aldolase family protein [Halocatena halophila]|uniref:HpcH/HpaI aldolase family protein n=1 Tax=Halocatena halophila TaxID=2814576 RepID=UPI002ED28233